MNIRNSILSIIILTTFGYSQWAIGIGETSADNGWGIAVDGSGNSYVTGSFQGTADFDPGAGTASLTSAGSRDIFVAKYDASGNYLWAFSVGSTSTDNGGGIAVDGSGNSYVTGDFQGTADFDPGAGTANLTSAGSTDIFIAKYDASGNYVWARNAGGTTGDWGTSVAVDGSSNSLVTGWFEGTADFDPPNSYNLTSAGNDDIFVAKYNPNGGFEASAPEITLKQGTTYKADGGIHNFGRTTTGSNMDAVFTIKNNGNADLTLTTPLTLGGADASEFSIHAQPSSTIASGETTTFTVRFSPTSTGAKTATLAIANNDSDEDPYDLTLKGRAALEEIPLVLQAYPNPFNPITTITYGLDTDSKVSITIYDITGKEINELLNTEQQQGWYSIEWNGTDYNNNQVPAGIYLGKISSNEQVKTIKLMLLK